VVYRWRTEGLTESYVHSSHRDGGGVPDGGGPGADATAPLTPGRQAPATPAGGAEAAASPSGGGGGGRWRVEDSSPTFHTTHRQRRRTRRELECVGAVDLQKGGGGSGDPRAVADVQLRGQLPSPEAHRQRHTQAGWCNSGHTTAGGKRHRQKLARVRL